MGLGGRGVSASGGRVDATAGDRSRVRVRARSPRRGLLARACPGGDALDFASKSAQCPSQAALRKDLGAPTRILQESVAGFPMSKTHQRSGQPP
jgi:hypothetical protein